MRGKICWPKFLIICYTSFNEVFARRLCFYFLTFFTMEKVLQSLIRETAEFGRQQLLVGLLIKHIKFIVMCGLVLVYGVNAFLKDLPYYTLKIEAFISEYPYLLIVFVLLATLYTSEKALRTYKR